MVGATRGLMAEPDMVNQARDGREEDSRTCLACNICLIRSIGRAWGCAINPETGHEKTWRSYSAAAQPSRVIVVGGGPAGLEAARTAALRGHQVTLLEKTNRLGGQMLLWAALPGREIFSTTPAWYERQLAKLGVQVRLEFEATAGSVLEAKPQAVIVATGSTYVRTGESGFMELPIPGWDRDFVHTPEDVIAGRVKAAGKMFILDEEGINTSAGVAELLAQSGADVTIITRWLQPLEHMIDTFEFALEIPRLRSLGVKFSTMSWIKEIGDHEITVFDVFTNMETRVADVAAVVMATSRRADLELGRALEGRVAQLFAVGDALAPRGLSEAVHEGHRFARLIGEIGAPADFADYFLSPIDYSVFQKPASVLLRAVAKRP